MKSSHGQQTAGRPPRPTVSSRSQRRRERQTAIVDTAAALFAEKGYVGTGIAELCDAVGLGKGSLYNYIGSKEDILARIHDRVMDDVLQSADDVLSLDIPPSHALRLMGVELIRIIGQYPNHVWVFLHEWRSLTGQRAVDFRRRRRRYEEAVEQILRSGVEQGEFQIDDIRMTALAWHNLHNYTYQWLRPEGELTPFQIANRFYDIFMNGVAAAPQSRARAGG